RRAFDAALDARRQAEQRLQQRALAGAVGADDGGHLASRDLGRHVMDRRMAVVAHRQVDQAKGGVHSAHQTGSHSASEIITAHATRVGALMASRAVPGETGSCMSICYNITLAESMRG